MPVQPGSRRHNSADLAEALRSPICANVAANQRWPFRKIDNPLSWSRRSRGHRHEAFPLRRRKWCPARAGDDEVDRFYARAITCDPAGKTPIDACTPTGGRPAPPDRNCATGRAGGHFPAMPPYFCRLNQYSPHRGASWEQAERCPEARELVSPGRLTTSKRDSTWRRHARAPSYGSTHTDVFRVPFELALS